MKALSSLLLLAALPAWCANGPAACVPMRWISDAPASLQLLDGSAVNCLLLEREQWSLRAAAQQRGLQALAVTRTPEEAAMARRQPFDAIILEGDFESPGTRYAIRLTPRRAIRFELPQPVAGTTEGVWPGIEIEHAGPQESAREAAPTGGVWIHTNTGFLRYLQAALPAVFWMANRPPENYPWSARRYVQAIADAAAAGARWVLALDAHLSLRLLANEPQAREQWESINRALRFYEIHGAWRQWKPYAEVALVQDTSSGALISGNLLDMLAVMNTPVRAVPSRELSAARLQGARVTIALHPESYTAEQQALIARFASSGGALITGPKGFRVPDVRDGRITFDKAAYQQLEKIWPELQQAIQRKNFGVRMFNVAGTLSHLLRRPDGGAVLLHLVNYTDYPVENITAFVRGRFVKAALYEPGKPPRLLEVSESPDGTGVDVDRLDTVAAILLEASTSK